jgi:Ca2+-transporting ATPase
LRTLAIAYRSVPAGTLEIEEVDERVEQHLIFAGLIGMIDPPRAEARDTVARAESAGIRPIMITGDHPVTAQVIERERGISADGRAVTGRELHETSDESLVHLAKSTSVYARS